MSRTMRPVCASIREPLDLACLGVAAFKHGKPNVRAKDPVLLAADRAACGFDAFVLEDPPELRDSEKVARICLVGCHDPYRIARW